LSRASFFGTLAAMRNHFSWLPIVFALAAFAARAAEKKFDFGEYPPEQTPPGFRSTLAGQGRPGEWKVIMDEVPPVLAPLTANAPAVTKRAVLAQLSRDDTDERFPILIYDGESFGDFTFKTRFKTVSGAVEQMAGIAFRMQDEKNYYVVRASSLGNTFRFYKVVNGERGPLIGPDKVEISKGAWHELTVECKGNQIRCSLNGKELIPPLTDSSFSSGKIGFWTKSDSISYFCAAVVAYTPKENLAQVLVRDAVKKYPRLLDLKIYALTPGQREPRVIAGKNEKDIGQPGGQPEQDVIARGTLYYGKGKQSVTVTMPLRDRNGEPAAAAVVTMKSFPGQTEQNAIVRATPIVKEMQARIPTLHDLLQ
jgi:hypothetical protein